MTNKICIFVISLIVLIPLYAKDFEDYYIWEPTKEEIEKAEEIATAYIYYILSDERLGQDIISIPPMNAQIAKKYNILLPKNQKIIIKDFEISKRPFNRYKKKHLSYIEDGNKIVTISYFDPETFPNWKEINGMDGGFSAYFTITIDMKSKKVIRHRANPM